MNSRNAFLIAGAAILILIAAVILLLMGGDDEAPTNTEPALNNGSAAEAVEALFAGNAGPARELACGDVGETLDTLAAELAAIPPVEGAEVTYRCDVGQTAGDCQIATTVGDQVTESYIEFGIAEDEICAPIEWIP